MRPPASIESQGAGSASSPRTGLVTLLFTDMVGSTALKHELGDRAAAELFRRHHEVIRETLKQFVQAEEIETAGDSFLITFATPSDAVEFALLAQTRLRRLSEGLGSLDRMGIHVGEVVLGHDTQSRKPRDLFGIQIDTCSRVMSLAKAGQTLMTRSVFDSARQVLKGEDIREVGALEWLNHGPYLLKGLDEHVEICEVREAGNGTGSPPTSSEKAQRKVSADEEPVLGWRPAVSQTIPNTRWLLGKKLGEGGFGEVWLGRHQHTKERRVFKFCFQTERVRFLKREMTLFRVLKERVGDHPNIVRLHDVILDEPPFYVEMDWVDGADLRNWCGVHGGIAALALETRLEIVAQAAEGLQAAHEAGIIHRDVKPANILIGNPKPEHRNPKLEVKLTDFGIGQVVSEESLKGITRAGFTETIISDSSSSRTGTQLYLAPELLAGKPASTRSDIYSLGVVLYQLLVADFTQPVTGDWSKEIHDPLLRDDLHRCLARKPEDRFAGADQLAKHLRALPARRSELERREAQKAALERAAYRRGIVRTAGVAGVILALVAALALIALNQSQRARAAAAAEKQERVRADELRRRAEAGERSARKNLYVASMRLVQEAGEQNDMGRLADLLEETASYPKRGFEWSYWQSQAHLSLLTLRGHTDGLRSVAFSPDGQRIATGSQDHTAKVWDTASGRELLTLRGHNSTVLSVAFSPDGRRITTGGADRTAKVWDAVSGRELLTLRGHTETLMCVAFSPDGGRIATGGMDQTAKVWNASTGRELLTLRGHTETVMCVAFSPDGQRIATGSQDHTAKVWDTASGNELLTFKRHQQMINSVAFSPDGQRIVSGSDEPTTRIWDAASGTELLTLPQPCQWVAFSPNGRRIVTCFTMAAVWDSVTGQLLRSFVGHNGYIWSVAFSPDGHRIATASKDLTAKVWDAELLLLTGHSARIRSVAASPDSQRILTGSDDGTAKVWDIATGNELLTLSGHSAPIRSVAFSPSGQRLATGSADGTAKVWDAATGRELLTLAGQSSYVLSVAFSPDSRRLVTGSFDGGAQLWEVATGQALLTLPGHKTPIQSAVFSPDGRHLLTGSDDGMARLLDADTGKEVLTLRAHSGPIQSLAFSPDGRQILTGSLDAAAKVWDTAHGQELLTLKGHRRGVSSVAFSPDGQRIVTGSFDGTAKLWEAADGKELLSLKGHTAEIHSVLFTADGGRIVTASGDHTARVWSAASAQQVAAWRQAQKAETERLEVLEREQATSAEHERALRIEDPGAIKQWLILAPILMTDRTYEGCIAAVNDEQIPGEGTLRPRAGDRVQVGARQLVWSALPQEDYRIDFNHVLGAQTDFSVAYAVSYIQSDRTQAGLVMKVGSDDGAKVYLNGQELERKPLPRSYSPDSDLVKEVEFRAGLNVLVFKVVNQGSAWEGSVRFTDAAGQPVKGIRVTLDPDK